MPFFSMSARRSSSRWSWASARSRVRDLFNQAKEAARDHLHRRARRDRRGAAAGGIDRRARRARADAQPDPDRDGRLLRAGGRDRAGGDQPARHARPGAAAPGRFDRRVTVAAPERGPPQDPRGPHAQRAAGDDVDLETIARPRRAWSGADLRNLVNEAALLAAAQPRGGHAADFNDALERSCSAPRARSSVAERSASGPPTTSPATRCCGMLEPGADPVRKVSIVPRGRALGVTFQSPEERTATVRRNLPAGADRRRAGRPRGRGDRLRRRDTGAESDLEQVTEIARQMVGRWGMSERGRTGVGAAREDEAASSRPACRRRRHAS